MDQPMFSCTRCMKSFPSSKMSRSGTVCKICNPHHSSFKQCDYCRSDFKRSISGTLCSRCKSLKERYGDPKPCSICQLTMAFGSSLVCQRCLHYRSKFGDPKQCEKCLQLCAFYKDEASRNKVDGHVLCWVCTYNYKKSKSKEHSDKHQLKRSSYGDSYSKSPDALSPSKRQRIDEFGGQQPLNRSANFLTDSLDSAYNDHLVTISQLQEEMRNLKRALAQKDAELLAKDREIAGLRADLGDLETQRRERAYKMQAMANEEIEKLKETIRTLKREKADILASRNPATKRRRGFNPGSLSPLKLSPLRLPPKMTTSASTPSFGTPPNATTSSKEKEISEAAEDQSISSSKNEDAFPKSSSPKHEAEENSAETKQSTEMKQVVSSPSPTFSSQNGGGGSESPQPEKKPGGDGNHEDGDDEIDLETVGRDDDREGHDDHLSISGSSDKD